MTASPAQEQHIGGLDWSDRLLILRITTTLSIIANTTIKVGIIPTALYLSIHIVEEIYQ